MIKLPTTGAFTVNIVGEAQYQDALRSIVGRPTKEGYYQRVTATLRPEPGNKADPSAVRVEIGRSLVGYLDRSSAKVYQAWLAKQGQVGNEGECPAVITGGFKRDDKVGPYGVVLDLGVKGVKRRVTPPADPSKSKHNKPKWRFW